MAILIVDDESQTREALRNLLTQLKYPVVLEAKNGEEALKMIQMEKSRVQMILSDLEMPYMDGCVFADRVAEDSELDRIPFLLITSDSGLAQSAQERNKIQRIDQFLIKPFRISVLEKNMNLAFIQRAKTRNQLLAIGKEELQNLTPVLKSPVAGMWNELRVTSRMDEWESTFTIPFSKSTAKIGGILIDPTPFTESEKRRLGEILNVFKKTPLGALTPIVCLSRNPREVFYFRANSQFFCMKENLLEDWQALLMQMETRILSTWQMESLFQEARYFKQDKKYSKARKSGEKMLVLDPVNSEALRFMGDILEILSHPQEALVYYQRALEVNPTLPRPYLKILMDPEHTLEGDSLLKIADDAILFCPHQVEVLIASAKCFLHSGDRAKTKRILETALKLEPTHLVAQQLLESLGST